MKYCYVFYAAVAHAALNDTARAIEGAPNKETPLSEADIGVLQAAIDIAGYIRHQQPTPPQLPRLPTPQSRGGRCAGAKTLQKANTHNGSVKIIRPGNAV